MVDETVARLPKLDREAILLRFFEDLEYEEIAQRLGITEPTARKRVSRALARLQTSLEEDQASATTSGAFVVAAPLGFFDKLSPILPSGGATTSTAATIVTTVTTNTALKATAAAVLGGILLIGNVSQGIKNKSLKEDLADARDELADLRGTGNKSTRNSGSESEQADKSASLTALNARLDTLGRVLEAEKSRREKAEKEVAALEEQLAPFKDEVVIAFGKVGEIGRDFGNLLTEALLLAQMEVDGRLEEEDIKTRLAKFIRSATSMTGLSEQIVEMESDPKEGSEFFSSTYAQIFGLDEAGQNELRQIFEKHISAATQRDITLKQIRTLIGEETPGGWEKAVEARVDVRRDYFRTVRAELRAAIPVERHADFDAWVELDGIGFNNIKIAELPLAFSLGGRPPKKEDDGANTESPEPTPAPAPAPAPKSNPE